MVLIVAAVLLLVPLASAFAYVDPRTGSMIVQVVIAALVAGAAFVGAFRTVRERARELIAVAHPDFRADLEAKAGKLGYL
jgi:hypothetical protein